MNRSPDPSDLRHASCEPVLPFFRCKGRGTRQTEEEEGRRGSVLRELRGGREAEVRGDRAAAREATRVRPPTPPT